MFEVVKPKNHDKLGKSIGLNTYSIIMQVKMGRDQM